MKVATNQERLIELFDVDPRNDTAIAHALGVSKQTISAWRNGTRSPKKPMLLEICKQFNVSIEWLMGFDVDREPTANKRAFVPNNELFIKVIQAMPQEDYNLVINAFERTLRKMKERGEIE